MLTSAYKSAILEMRFREKGLRYLLMSNGIATIRTIQIIVSLGCLIYDIITEPGGFHKTSLIFIITVFDWTGSTAKMIKTMCNRICGRAVTQVFRVISWVLVIVLSLMLLFVFPAKWTSDGAIDVEGCADSTSKKIYNSDDFTEFRFKKSDEPQTEDNENQAEDGLLPPKSFYYSPQYLGGGWYVQGEPLCWATIISCIIISAVDIVFAWVYCRMFRKRDQNPNE